LWKRIDKILENNRGVIEK